MRFKDLNITELRLGDQVTKKVDKFCYLGSVTTTDVEAAEDIINLISVAMGSS